MTPAARIQAAIEIFTQIETSNQAADKFLREWFGARRFAGSKDRASVSQRVYAVLRHRASFAWRMQSESPRALVIASLLAEGAGVTDIEALFDGVGYGAKPLDDTERAALNATPPDAPPHVQGEYPEWLQDELQRGLGESLGEEMQAMLARASIDLRVNALKAQRDEVLAGLQALAVDATPTPFSPWGLRIASDQKLSSLQHTEFFQAGAFEFQDEASQIVSLLCAAKPGDRVLDLAAGAGGKSLALAAVMENSGEIVACDIDDMRMKSISPRAKRAGISMIRQYVLVNGPPPETFPIVLLDAPCSGSGTWRRNPETKWRLTPQRLDELVALQARLLDQAAESTAPGGRLIYAVCSLLPREGKDQVAAFLARRQGFRMLNAAAVWREAVPGAALPPGLGETFQATPAATGTDGFFAAVLCRED